MTARTFPKQHVEQRNKKWQILNLCLGQVANYCPVLFRDTIVKNSTSIQAVWQAIRTHFGFQSTGAHFLDFDAIQLEPGERPEDLFNVSQVLLRTTCSNTEAAIPTMVR